MSFLSFVNDKKLSDDYVQSREDNTKHCGC